MYQYYVYGARVEQYQQQERRQAAGARSIAALTNDARKQVVIPGLTHVRLLLAVFKAVITPRPA